MTVEPILYSDFLQIHYEPLDTNVTVPSHAYTAYFQELLERSRVILIQVNDLGTRLLSFYSCNQDCRDFMSDRINLDFLNRFLQLPGNHLPITVFCNNSFFIKRPDSTSSLVPFGQFFDSLSKKELGAQFLERYHRFDDAVLFVLKIFKEVERGLFFNGEPSLLEGLLTEKILFDFSMEQWIRRCDGETGDLKCLFAKNISEVWPRFNSEWFAKKIAEYQEAVVAQEKSISDLDDFSVEWLRAFLADEGPDGEKAARRYKEFFDSSVIDDAQGLPEGQERLKKIFQKRQSRFDSALNKWVERKIRTKDLERRLNEEVEKVVDIVHRFLEFCPDGSKFVLFLGQNEMGQLMVDPAFRESMAEHRFVAFRSK